MICSCGTDVDGAYYAAALALKARVAQRPWPVGTTITCAHWHITRVVSVTVVLPTGAWFQWDSDEEFNEWSRQDKRKKKT